MVKSLFIDHMEQIGLKPWQPTVSSPLTQVLQSTSAENCENQRASWSLNFLHHGYLWLLGDHISRAETPSESLDARLPPQHVCFVPDCLQPCAHPHWAWNSRWAKVKFILSGDVWQPHSLTLGLRATTKWKFSVGHLEAPNKAPLALA